MSKYCNTCKNKGTIDSKCCTCCIGEIRGEELFRPSNYEPITGLRDQRHMNGLLFDDLVYRYKYALEMATEARADSMFCMGTGKYTTKKEAMGAARKQNERDVIRFCQLLDEAIGDRD